MWSIKSILVVLENIIIKWEQRTYKLTTSAFRQRQLISKLALSKVVLAHSGAVS